MLLASSLRVPIGFGSNHPTSTAALAVKTTMTTASTATRSGVITEDGERRAVDTSVTVELVLIAGKVAGTLPT